MKNKLKLSSIALATTMALALTACGGSSSSTAEPTPAPATTESTSDAKVEEAPADEPLEIKKVRIGYHANEGGASVIAVADEMGFFAEQGLEVEMTKVESGPVEMAAMRAGNRTLDMGYIGAGVAWNAIDSTGNGVKFVFFDGLSDAEALIARTGEFSDDNGNGFYDYEEIYDGLKGKKVYLDTSTTPGGWLKSMIVAVNEGRPEGEQLWIHSETTNYLDGYTAPNSDPEYMVDCIHLANSNIASAMSTSSGDRVDIAVAFAPVPATALAANSDVEHIAATTTHLPNDAQPSSWVASEEWMAEDPDAVQRVVNALQKASAVRAEDPDEACRQAEILCQAPDGTFDPSVAIWPSEDLLKEWFSDESGMGYVYMKALYESKKASVPEGVEPRAFEDCIDFSYMLNAF